MTTSDLPARPDWMPEAVYATATRLWSEYDGKSERGVVITQRLGFDPRMKAVWRTFQKRKRLPGRPFEHPVTLAAFLPEADPDKRQHCALAFLFEAVVNFAESGVHTITYSDRDAYYQRLKDDILACFSAANTMENMGLSQVADDIRAALAPALRYVQNAYDDNTMLGSDMMSERRHQDPQGRGTAGVVIGVCRQFFGKAMEGCAVTMAEVALGRTITTIRIRPSQPRK